LAVVLGGGAGDAGDAGVDVVVDPGVQLVDLGAQLLRVEVGRAGGPGAELGGHVDGDVGEVVADDPVGHPVPEHRDGDVAAVALLGRVVRLLQQGEAVDRVVAAALAEGPAAAVALVVHVREGDDVLQPGELADDGGAVRVRAGPGDVEVVAAGLCGVAAGAVGGDAALEGVDGPVPVG